MSQIHFVHIRHSVLDKGISNLLNSITSTVAGAHQSGFERDDSCREIPVVKNECSGLS
jgi:hypothetical protein